MGRARWWAVLALIAGPGGAAEIGTVAATNPRIDSTAPGAALRTLVLGETLVENEHIQTSAQGSGQFMFLDQTTMTVAPLSDFVIDKYVYDPSRQTGTIAVSMAKGSLRFIGGRVTKSETATLRTPTATIGIRGGMALVVLGSNGATQVVHLAGQFTSVSQYGDGNGDGVDDGPPPGTPLGTGVDTEVLSRPNASALADTGGVTFTGLVTAAQLASAYAKLEGSGSGGSESPPAEAAVETAGAAVAQVNSEAPGAETRTPISTSGEARADPTPPPPSVDVGQDDAPGAEDPGNLPIDEAVVFPVATAGAALLPDGGFSVFDSVTTGSLIGESDEGAVRFEVGVPTSADDLTLTLDDLDFALPHSDNVRGGFIVSRGFFGTADLEQHGVQTAMSLIGFSDLSAGFHLFGYIDGDLGDAPTPGKFGFGVFGVPTTDQAAVLADALSGPDGANTLDRFAVVQIPLIGDDAGTVRPTTAFLVGNADDTTAAPRWLLGQVAIDNSGSAQESGLVVLAQQAGFSATGAPMLNGTAYVQNRDQGRSEVTLANLGTFADAGGNTLFGASGEYVVVSSVRPNGAGGAQEFDPGLSFGIDPQGALRDERETADPVAVLLARDTAAAQVVTDPTPLAGANNGLGLGRGESFATGIAQCGGGACGHAPGSGSQTGSYVLTTGSHSDAGGAQIGFQSASAISNGILGQLQLVTGAAGAQGGGGELVLNFGAGGSTGAYIDDNRFAATGQFQGGSVFGQGGGSASSAIASAGLAGTGGLFATGVETQPEFLRWGWWSADYSVTGTDGAQRDDVVHLGTWVAGDRPDIADLPLVGVAEYDGFAAGTVARYDAAGTATTDIRVIGGDFSLRYDFGAGSGAFTLRLPDVGFDQTLAVAAGGALGDYAGSSAAGGDLFRAEGSFFQGGGNPIAATAGEFVIETATTAQQVTGVYGGDLNSFDPSGQIAP